jgi:hypothetical protein
MFYTLNGLAVEISASLPEEMVELGEVDFCYSGCVDFVI